MSDYDGLRGCAICGNDTTGRLCRSCAEQQMIDAYDGDYDAPDGFDVPEEDKYCPHCGGSGLEDDVSECPECDGTGYKPEYW